jgi:hypothetical protein
MGLFLRNVRNKPTIITGLINQTDCHFINAASVDNGRLFSRSCNTNNYTVWAIFTVSECWSRRYTHLSLCFKPPQSADVITSVKDVPTRWCGIQWAGWFITRHGQSESFAITSSKLRDWTACLARCTKKWKTFLPRKETMLFILKPSLLWWWPKLQVPSHATGKVHFCPITTFTMNMLVYTSWSGDMEFPEDDAWYCELLNTQHIN